MSSLLTLAKDLEQTSKAQQQSTEVMLKSAFSKHEKSVTGELNSSAKRISDAIRLHEQSMAESIASNRQSVLRMAGRTWLTLTLTTILLTGTCGSVLWWQGQQIVSNLVVISQQENSLTMLNAKTWGVTYQTSKDGRRFLVMPKGMKPEVIPYNGTHWIQLKQE